MKGSTMKKFYDAYLLVLLFAGTYILSRKLINIIQRELYVRRNRPHRSDEANRLLWQLAHS